MFYDPRISMGMLFTLIGTILTAFGLATRSNPDVYVKSMGDRCQSVVGTGSARVWNCSSRTGSARPDQAGEEEVAISVASEYSLLPSIACRTEAHGAVVEGVALELVEGVDAEYTINIVAGG